MNDSPTGRTLGQDTYNAQVAAGVAFLQSLGGALPTAAQAAVLAQLMAQLAGNATITHVPGFDTITFDPSSGSHTDPDPNAQSAPFARPVPALAMQVDGTGAYVALWLKTGGGVHDWTNLSVGGATLSTEIPYPPGIGDPGATDSGEATAKQHVHPSADNAGGDLYLIDEEAAVPLVYYADGAIGFGLNPEMLTTPAAAWDSPRNVAAGSSQGGY